ncbi:MAG: molecular chaperone DnaK [Candidatus Altiarchaeales archaeon HGW-Altiarchaeales-2]|nr:MAG: molecular chaperone DnaK [Candidatus Altiarchaeales archaeon HGW-Altiarchaeales-2]
MGDILGIDLGTTNSCAAFIEFGEAVVIENAEYERTTPSVVYFKKEGGVVVGKLAKQNIVVNANRTVKSIKRHIGTDYAAEIDGEKYTSEYISAHILKKLINDAEKFTGRKFTDAIISVPAYFTDAQRQATKDAGEIAGLNVRRIINEPTASAISYGYTEKDKKTVLVYDFGGGTFDVSILSIRDGFFDVEATAGDNHLGGDDVDDVIENIIISEIKKKYDIDVKNDLFVYQTLKEKVEKTKIDLSAREESSIDLPYIGKAQAKPITYSRKINRKELGKILDPFLERAKKQIMIALDDASLKIENIDEVILVGAMTRIPYIRKFVEDLFHKKPKVPIKITKNFTNPLPFMDEIYVTAYQGESLFPDEDDADLLGKFIINIEPMPAGQNKIEATFEIGEEFGILLVTAKDTHSGNERTVKIISRGRLSKQDKDKWTKTLSDIYPVEVNFDNVTARKTVTLLVNPSSTIGSIKNKLKEGDMINEGEGLFYGNKELSDDSVLSDLNIDKEKEGLIEIRKRA